MSSDNNKKAIKIPGAEQSSSPSRGGRRRGRPAKNASAQNQPHSDPATMTPEQKAAKAALSQNKNQVQNKNQKQNQNQAQNQKQGQNPNYNQAPNQNQNQNQSSNSKRGRGRPKKTGDSPLRMIPLGGLGEVGKNMMVYECQGDAIIVDVGLSFPDESMPGVDLVIPDFTYVIENRDRIKGIVITHGHEDHIGGLAYLFKQAIFPVYATRLTIGLIEGKLKEHGLLDKVTLNVVKPRDTIRLGCFGVEFINVNHSIPDACSMAIHTPYGTLVHTGDFKVDYTPINGNIIDLARFGELGSKGVLALLSDSTNAERPGSSGSESVVGVSFDKLFAQAEKKRIIVATFASNVHRVQQIVDAAVKFKRKIAVSGRSMENVVNKALEMGYLNIPSGVLIDVDAIERHPDNKMVIITTGSQGEPMSALTRMAMGDHRKVRVTPNDCIIISASPIPGNEKLVTRVINELLKQGSEVIYDKMYEIHVSGHASQDELKMMMALTKPKFFIPIHGEYKHQCKHAELAHSMGIEKKNVLVPDIGKVIETDGNFLRFGETVTAGKVLVDGLGVGDVGSIVLRDRRHLAEDGLIVVVTTIDRETGQILSGPDIVSRGFVYVRESEDMIGRARNIARQTIQKCIDNNTREWGVFKQKVRDDVSDYLWQMTKRSPMILPVIQEI